MDLYPDPDWIHSQQQAESGSGPSKIPISGSGLSENRSETRVFMFILSGEPSRGAYLECLVAKIKHLNNTTANTSNNTNNNTSNTSNNTANTTNNTNNTTANNTNNTSNNTSNNNSNNSGQAEASERIQLIAMSATVGNLRELAHFLSAELFTDDWRPVRLEEFVKVGRDIFQVAGGGSSSDQCCGSGIRVPF
jgi:hypothetical protein